VKEESYEISTSVAGMNKEKKLTLNLRQATICICTQIKLVEGVLTFRPQWLSSVCRTNSLILGEEFRPRVSENRVLRKTFGSNREQGKKIT